MAFADTASRKLLHGAGGAIVRAAAAADGNGAVGMSFGLDGLWQLIAELFGSAVHLLVLPFELLWRLLQTAVAGAAHLLLLPFEALWHLLQSAAAGVGLCFDGLWRLVHGFFADILAAAVNAAHMLVAPLEALCRWLSGAAHTLVLPFEAFWRWMQNIVADAAAGISIGLDGFWPLVRRSFASVLATLAGAADELVPALEAFWVWAKTTAADELVPDLEASWRWAKTAAAVALPYVLCIALAVSLVALVWFFWPLLAAAAALTGKALMCAGVEIAKALVLLVSYLLPVCTYCFQCCASATMTAPGAAGFLISRAAFVANPAIYFQILHSAGSVVAAALFSTPAVAAAVAAPVATLFRA